MAAPSSPASSPHRIPIEWDATKMVIIEPRDAGAAGAQGVQVRVPDPRRHGVVQGQRAKYDRSVALAERVLLPAVRRDPSAIVVADGFSCREQLRQLAQVRARHLAELLAAVPVLAPRSP
jgi:hypothetical protein